MKTALSRLEVVKPRDLSHALHLLAADAAEPLTPIAGCTDVLVGLNFGTLEPGRYLDLWGLKELVGIRRTPGGITIGARTTYADLRTSDVIRAELPMLAEASRWIGGPQVQARGTIGGNIINASPAGDTLPVLAAADATVVLASATGTRKIPFVDLYTGYRKTVRTSRELLVSVEIPLLEGVGWFRKVGTRQANAISKIVMAAVRADWPRVALGSVGPTVLRLPRTEYVLAEGGSIDDACTIMLEEIEPIDDIRSTRGYRRQVAANLLRQWWAETAPPKARATPSRSRAAPRKPAAPRRVPRRR